MAVKTAKLKKTTTKQGDECIEVFMKDLEVGDTFVLLNNYEGGEESHGKVLSIEHDGLDMMIHYLWWDDKTEYQYSLRTQEYNTIFILN